MKTIQKITRILFHLILYTAFGVFLLTGMLRTGILLFARPRTNLTENSPQAPVALVLGAGLNRDGSPGLVLRDRVRTASELYFNGQVEKILMSGDNTEEYYNEPGAMKEFALMLGVPEEDIVLDRFGVSTYDSCTRAKTIFKVDRLLIITQAYHLPRALFLCHSFDIEAYGVPADEANYRISSYTFWWTREVLATVKAYWDVYFACPIPITGEPQPIFPDNP